MRSYSFGKSARQLRLAAAVEAVVDPLESRRFFTATALAQPTDSVGGDLSIRPSAASSGPRSSPFSPEEGGGRFTTDAGPYLDTGYIYREGGPILVDVIIDRKVKDVDKAIADGTLPKTVKIITPVYDIDYDGEPGRAPERDVLTVNGQAVSGTAGSYLTGSNETWKQNEFTLPTTALKFATDAGPGVNTIKIDIDLNNAGWALAVDWVQIYVKPVTPVLFVHGIISDASTWDKASFSFLKETEKLGIPTKAISVEDGVLGKYRVDPMQDNAQQISAAVDQLLKETGAEKVDIVAHSKGGLDSRYYISALGGYKKVNELVELGSPNLGSPAADKLLALGVGVAAGFGGVIGGLSAAIAAGGGAWQLTTDFWKKFHLPAAPGVKYYAAAGNYKAGGLGIVDYALAKFTGQNINDGIVPQYSVYGLPGGSFVTIGGSGALHTDMTSAPSFFNFVKPKVLPDKSANKVLAPAAAAEPDDLLDTVLKVPTGGKSTPPLTLPISAAGDAGVLVFAAAGVVGTLTAPDGKTYRTDAPSTGAGIVGFSDAATGAIGFSIPAAFTKNGKWTLTLTSAKSSSGADSSAIVSITQDTPFTLTATATSLAGGALKVRATLDGTSGPVTGATLVLNAERPDGTSFKVPMTLSGQEYVADIANPQAGAWVLKVSASGGGVAGLQASTTAGVAGSGSKLTGVYSEQTYDDDKDNRYDGIRLTLGLDIKTAGHYLIQGSLKGPGGEDLGQIGSDLNLAVGVQDVTIDFDAGPIFAAGLKGPYTIGDVRLVEADGVALATADETAVAITTNPYDPNDFEGPDVLVTDGADGLTDLDADALADTLDVTLDVKARVPGTYAYSASLFDAEGNEIGFANGTTTLAGGVGQVKLSYDGQAIGKNGVDGPFYVRNLLINQQGGVAAAVVDDAYTTTAYPAAKFEGYVTPPTTTVGSITGLTLIDAKADKPLGRLGSTVSSVADALAKRFSIRAETTGMIGSVAFKLDGKLVRVEADTPWALFSNTGNDYYGGKLTAGKHTLEVTPYSAIGGTGLKGKTYTAIFTVKDATPAATQFSIIDTRRDKVLAGYSNVSGTVTISGKASGVDLAKLSVRALPAGPVTQVDFYLNGSLVRHERFNPYALFGNDESDYFAPPGQQAFAAGKTYALTVKVVHTGGTVEKKSLTLKFTK